MCHLITEDDMFRIKSYTWIGLAVVTLTVLSVGAVTPWFVRTWQSDAGLPDNTVVSIDQTPDGFLWLLTQTGLVRFDGVQFREFSVRVPGRWGRGSYAFCVDRRGRLWVAKDAGAVVCVDQGKQTVVIAPNTTRSDRRVRMFVEDGEGAVWVSFIDGDLVRLQDGVQRLFTREDGLPAGGASELTVDQNGQLWFLRGGWVGIFRNGRFQSLVQAKGDRICAAHAGGVWLCTSTQIVKYTETGGFSKYHDLKTGMDGAGPTVLLEDQAERLWIGTRLAGLFCYDGKSIGQVDTSQQTILSLKEDQEGNIWVGTRGGGLKQIRPRVAELMITGSGSPFEGIQSICKDTDGQLWAVIWQKGTVVQNRGVDWTPLSVSDGWEVDYSKCVAADPQGGVWIGTAYKGLYHWQDGIATHYVCLTNDVDVTQVTALRTTELGTVWIGARRFPDGKCFLVCGKDGAFRSYSMPSNCGTVTAIEVDASGTCWAATSKGLLVRVRDDVLTQETRNMLTEPYPIRALLATPDNSLWIGYAGIGLGRLKDGHVTYVRMSQGLHDDYISHILSDGRGRLWLAGNRGIFSVREKDLDELAEGRSTHVQSVAYKQKDGLRGLQASYDASPGAFRDADGRLFFAMQSGVAVLYAADIQEDPLPPSVMIDLVLANGKVVARYGVEGSLLSSHASASLKRGQPDGHLHLQPGQRQVEFAFTVPSFTMPDSIGIKYRLQGLDKDWIDAGLSRSVLYSQLAPGRYQFQVTACNRDGVWSKENASLALIVEPFWWETSWFRFFGPLSVIGLLAGLIVLWVRRRHQHQLERLEMQQATEQERLRIAQDLHDDLGSNLAEIAMVSELAQNELPEGDPSQKQFNAIFVRAENNVRRLGEIVWAINPVNDTLERFIGYVCKFAQDHLALAHVRCRFDLPENVPEITFDSIQRHNLLLATKEAIHNAVQHGSPSEITIRFNAGDGMVVVTIEDNGCGFDTTGPVPTNRGSANMIMRMEKIGGTFTRRSVLGQGTTVILTAPFTIPPL